MDNFYEDTLKAREVPVPSDENINFTPMKESAKNKRDRKASTKSNLSPRKAQLLEDMLENSGGSSSGVDIKNDAPHEFDENAVSCSIQAVCGRMTHSNESVKMFLTRLINKESPTTVDDKDTSTQVIQSENTIGTKAEEQVLRRSGLSRNSAIKGLLRKNLISLKDIQVPSDSKTPSPTMKKNTASTYPGYVPHPEDSDVYVRPLEAYEKLEEEFKDIDFTVTHVGKKKVTTPRQFYLGADEACFKFVKHS